MATGVFDPFMPPVDDQFTIEPPPVGTMVRMPCLVPSITPKRLTDMIRSYSVDRGVRKRTATADAGDVQARRRLAERLHRRGEHRFDVGLLRHVGMERDERVAELLGRLLLPTAHVSPEHTGALPHEHACRGASHSRTGTGDDCNFCLRVLPWSRFLPAKWSERSNFHSSGGPPGVLQLTHGRAPAARAPPPPRSAHASSTRLSTSCSRDGYAAVTSRRVETDAGLKLHYHFGTLDDLFVAVFRRRAERNVERMQAALASAAPLREWWRLASDPRGTALLVELTAAANHRAALQAEVAELARDVRQMQMDALGSILAEYGMDAAEFPPALIAAAVQGLALVIVEDQVRGFDTGHGEAAGRDGTRLVERLETASGRAPASLTEVSLIS